MNPYHLLGASTVAVLGAAGAMHFSTQQRAEAGVLDQINPMPLDQIPSLTTAPVSHADLREVPEGNGIALELEPVANEDNFFLASSRLIVKLKSGVDINDALPALEDKIGQKLTLGRQLLPNLFELETDHGTTYQELKHFQTDVENLDLFEFCDLEVNPDRLKPTEDDPVQTNDEKTRQQLKDSGYSDEFIERQWSLVEPQDNLEENEAFGANVLKAHSITKGKSAVGAVIDAGSGVEPHSDMRDRFCDPRFGDHVDYCNKEQGGGHGMFVSGQIAANEDNGIGIAGVAPESKLTLLKGLSACGDYSDHEVLPLHVLMLHAGGIEVDGLPKNENPASVINLSLGGNAECPAYMQEVIDALDAKGVSVVVAAGNEKRDARCSMPANCDKVITVGASDYLGQLTSYSNFGPRVDLLAPGGDSGHPIVSLSNMGPDSYSLAMGTSMATPITSGAVLLMQSLDPTLMPQEIRQILKDSSRELPHGCFRGDEKCGAGVLDTFAAVSIVMQRLQNQGRLSGSDIFTQQSPIDAPFHAA